MFEGINSIDFYAQFHNDETCYKYLADLKWKDGYICKKCKHTSYSKGNLPYYRRCKNCGYDESVTAHTMFHKCKMGIQKAFVSMYEIISSKKGIASTTLSEKVSVNIKTAWLIRRKVQESMKPSCKKKLQEYVEVDETSVGGYSAGMPGRTLEGKKHAIVALGYDEQGNSTRAYAMPIEDFTNKSLRTIFDKHIDKDAFVMTDGFRGYNALHKEYKNMDYKLSEKGSNFEKLHYHIFNIKNWIRGIHHQCSQNHFCAYLDEFNFRFNNRGGELRKNIFNHLLTHCIYAKPSTYSMLINKCDLSG
jgi:transposase-like protein